MKKQNDAPERKLPKKVVSLPAKVTIRKIPTGVRGLDDILGGGIPEFSFNIIAGMPGCGKTTKKRPRRNRKRRRRDNAQMDTVTQLQEKKLAMNEALLLGRAWIRGFRYSGAA